MGRWSSRATSIRVVSGSLIPWAGEPASGKPHTASKYASNGIPAACGDVLGGELDPGVRVDPLRTRFGDRLGAVERQARGVGEQVAKRRAGRAGRILERDDPSSTATSAATAVASFVTEAQRSGSSTSPCVSFGAVGVHHGDRGVTARPTVDLP